MNVIPSDKDMKNPLFADADITDFDIGKESPQ